MNWKFALTGTLSALGLAVASPADAQVRVGRGGVTVGNPGYFGGGPGVSFGRGGVGYNNGFYNYGSPYSSTQFSPRYGWNSGYNFARPVYGAGYSNSPGYYSRGGYSYSQPSYGTGTYYTQPGVTYSYAQPAQSGVVQTGYDSNTSAYTPNVVQAGGTAGTTTYQPNVVPAGAMMGGAAMGTMPHSMSYPGGMNSGDCGGCDGGYVHAATVSHSDGCCDSGHGKRKRGLRRR